MKKLLLVLALAALIFTPFADTADARGGRGGGRGAGRNIGGAANAGKKSTKKNQTRKRDQNKSEDEDGMVSGRLRRRGR